MEPSQHLPLPRVAAVGWSLPIQSCPPSPQGVCSSPGPTAGPAAPNLSPARASFPSTGEPCLNPRAHPSCALPGPALSRAMGLGGCAAFRLWGRSRDRGLCCSSKRLTPSGIQLLTQAGFLSGWKCPQALRGQAELSSVCVCWRLQLPQAAGSAHRGKHHPCSHPQQPQPGKGFRSQIPH